MKKYKTIKEVSNLLNINQHVIRYWDSKFEGLSIRFSSKKQRFFNNDHIKKIKDLQANLYQNGKIKYPKYIFILGIFLYIKKSSFFKK